MQPIYLTGLGDKAAFHLTTAQAPHRNPPLSHSPGLMLVLTANTFIHGKGRWGGCTDRDDPSQWASRLGDLSHPLPAALGMWERSTWPSGLSVAKVPHSVAIVLKLDPIKEQEKQGNKSFSTQPFFLNFNRFILARV